MWKSQVTKTHSEWMCHLNKSNIPMKKEHKTKSLSPCDYQNAMLSTMGVASYNLQWCMTVFMEL